eukprot:c21606_g1_i1.p2 GENE.c21606_g1_i1~~c21606_g1_i1.p2  ORF type:complete len:254 (-),score=56.71 c21606_g1_i1:425-1186(-)
MFARRLLLAERSIVRIVAARSFADAAAAADAPAATSGAAAAETKPEPVDAFSPHFERIHRQSVLRNNRAYVLQRMQDDAELYRLRKRAIQELEVWDAKRVTNERAKQERLKAEAAAYVKKLATARTKRMALTAMRTSAEAEMRAEARAKRMAAYQVYKAERRAYLAEFLAELNEESKDWMQPGQEEEFFDKGDANESDEYEWNEILPFQEREYDLLVSKRKEAREEASSMSAEMRESAFEEAAATAAAARPEG